MKRSSVRPSDTSINSSSDGFAAERPTGMSHRSITGDGGQQQMRAVSCRQPRISNDRGSTQTGSYFDIATSVCQCCTRVEISDIEVIVKLGFPDANSDLTPTR